MTPQLLLQKIEVALDLLVDAGARYDGLIPSILDRQSATLPEMIPGPIPGQRQHDRAHHGSNLLHDVELLELMYLLAKEKGRAHYAEAADRYIHRFATHCTNTVSGLFPWGEHAFWDLQRDELGNSQVLAGRTISRGAYHDHLREAPVWLWEKIWAANPACVERFGYGLKYHWKSGKLAHEYFRHAYLERPDIPLPHESGSRDFPRHGGFYILDWAYAYTRFGRADFEAQMRRMNDYWWWHHESNMLPQFSRDDNTEKAENWLSLGQSLSYAATTLDAAQLLRKKEVLPDLSKSLYERAVIYANGCITAPNRMDGVFHHMFERDGVTPAAHSQLVAWGSTYSMQAEVASKMTISSLTAFIMRIYRHLNDERYLAWCEAAARFVLSQPFPKDAGIPARDAGQALHLLLDLYDATKEPYWKNEAQKLAATLAEIYLDGPLPRLASGEDWYEAQQGTGGLLLALGKGALLNDER